MTVVDDIATSADNVLSNVANYAETHSEGITALLLLLGVVITFSGRILLRPTVFLLGFAPTTSSITAFGVALLADHSSGWARHYQVIFQMLVFLFALSMGLLVGIVMVRLLFRVVTFLLCGGLGAVLVLIFHMLILQPAGSQNALLVWYAAMILAGLITALISVGYPETTVILGTSFDGAALAVFSVARFLGHRPRLLAPTGSESAIGWDAMEHWWAISYGVAAILLALFGAMAQRRVAIADAIMESASRQVVSVTTPLLFHEDLRGDADITDVTDAPRGVNKRLSMPVRPRSRYLLPSVDDSRQVVTVIEPPRSPAYRRSGSQSPPAFSAYGAADVEDAQYSVVHNLGAEPLVPSIEPRNERNNSRGPL